MSFTTTSTSCYCLEMSEIKTMSFKQHGLKSGRLKKRKPIEDELISPKQLDNFHRKRHNKRSVAPRLRQL